MSTSYSGQAISNEDIEKIKRQQNQTYTLVKDETSRLQLKKDNMDVENQNRNRMITLNQSYRDRQREYLLIMIIFLILLGMSLALVFLQERLGISTFVLDWAIIFIVAFGIITGYLMINSIYKRDNIEFSKLSQENGGLLKAKSEKKEYTDATEEGRITDAVAITCEGASCCGPGYTFSGEIMKCEANT